MPQMSPMLWIFLMFFNLSNFLFLFLYMYYMVSSQYLFMDNLKEKYNNYFLIYIMMW